MRTALALLLLALAAPAFAGDKPQVLQIAPPPAAAAFSPTVTPQKIEGGYAIVVSKATLADKAWAQVVGTLKQKYGDQAQVIVWEKSVDDAKPALSKMMPHYTCFVTEPKDANRVFVAQVHRLARNLNQDPYPDTVWAILTGLNAADANRIAATCAPLVIRTAVSTTGVQNDLYDSVFTLSDGAKGKVFAKGKAAEAVAYPKAPDADRAHALADAFHAMKPDLFVTSSHANENILEMPFSAGAILGKNGAALAVESHGAHGHLSVGPKGWAIASPNPKAWLAAGNCLSARIRNNDSIALAMMHSAGVTQMVGYTVPTWYGAGGWGTLEWFQNQPGRFSMAESFFINDAAMTRKLAKEFPGKEDFAVQVYDENNIGALAEPLGMDKMPGMNQAKAKDLLGLTWDHDTVALYGDPAWDVRIAPHGLGFEQKLSETRLDGDRRIKFGVEAKRDGHVKAFAFLPTRISAAAIKAGEAKGATSDALLTETYVLVDFGDMKAGEKKDMSWTIPAGYDTK